MLGVIAGTGFERFFSGIEAHCPTPYGSAMAILDGKKKIAFISRHGTKHAIPPHMINSKANMYAFKKLGVTEIFGVSTCGAIARYKPGDLVLVGDFIDFRSPPTIYDKLTDLNQHAWMVPPFSPFLQTKIIAAAKKSKVPLKRGGVIGITSGPRFETPAEIRALKKMGANLVGMTASPEAILARELGLEYCSTAVVSNYAAGIKGARSEDIAEIASKQAPRLMRIVIELGK